MPMSDSYGGDLEFLPKIGESKVFEIESSYRKEEPGNKSNFKNKTGTDFGYHFVWVLRNGKKVPMGNWQVFFACKEKGVMDGDTIEVNHVGHGKYVVTVMRNPDIATNAAGDLDYLKEIEKRNSEKNVEDFKDITWEE